MVKKWKKLNEKIQKVGWRSIAHREFQFPDGRKDNYTIYNDKNSVAVLALTENNKVILFKQFRPGPEKILLELPGGVCESKKPIEDAKKELLEETGYSGNMKLLGKSYHCSYSTRIRYNFIATNCKKVAKQKLDKNEFGDVVLMSIADFKKHLKTGKLTDAETGYMGLEYLNK